MAEFLPEPLAAFLVANSNIDIDLTEKPSIRIIEGVAEGLADIGIVAKWGRFRRSGNPAVPGGPTGGRGPDHDHPVAAFRQIAFREILDAEFVGLDQSATCRNISAAMLARMEKTLKLRDRMTGVDAISREVAQGVDLA